MGIMADYVLCTMPRQPLPRLPINLQAEEHSGRVHFKLLFPADIMHHSGAIVELVASIKDRPKSWQRPRRVDRRFKKIGRAIRVRLRRMIGERSSEWPGSTAVILQDWLGAHREGWYDRPSAPSPAGTPARNDARRT